MNEQNKKSNRSYKISILLITIATIGIIITILAAIGVGKQKINEKQSTHVGSIGQNGTQIFLGNDRDDVKIALIDVQGLWGGRNIFILGSGKIFVQVVYREPKKSGSLSPLLEKRYVLSLADDEIRKLINVFIENDFITINLKDRPGIPDEAMPTIILVNGKGQMYKISKWESDKDIRFDTIYQEILLLETRIKNLETVFTGIYDSKFMPEGMLSGEVNK